MLLKQHRIYASLSVPKCGVEDSGVEISGVNDGVRNVFPVLYTLTTRKTTKLYEVNYNQNFSQLL